MSDEHVKLVAKIQYFYDVMIQRLNETEDNGMSSSNDLERISYREKSAELTYLTSEFSKTFQNFLYRESHE
jgi:hypothetical protein